MSLHSFFRETMCRPDPWQGERTRPRVLVETPDAWAIAKQLEGAGYEVATCHGPGPGERCPLLAEGSCPTAAGADAIVSALPSDAGVSVVAALHDEHPDTPVVAEVPRPKAALYPGASRLLAAPLDLRGLLASLEDVLSRG